MKFIKFFLIGIFFGIIATKSEIISWYRIYEMFRFESFHMYGVIGSAVITGIISIQIIKKFKIKNIDGKEINSEPKSKKFIRYIVGGAIFGLGWAMTGACPGPMFVLLGNGLWAMALVIISATFGTFLYGIIKDKLPH